MPKIKELPHTSNFVTRRTLLFASYRKMMLMILSNVANFRSPMPQASGQPYFSNFDANFDSDANNNNEYVCTYV